MYTFHNSCSSVVFCATIKPLLPVLAGMHVSCVFRRWFGQRLFLKLCHNTPLDKDRIGFTISSYRLN